MPTGPSRWRRSRRLPLRSRSWFCSTHSRERYGVAVLCVGTVGGVAMECLAARAGGPAHGLSDPSMWRIGKSRSWEACAGSICRWRRARSSPRRAWWWISPWPAGLVREESRRWCTATSWLPFCWRWWHQRWYRRASGILSFGRGEGLEAFAPVRSDIQRRGHGAHRRLSRLC